MKYLFKNIKSFIRDDAFIFIMILVTVILSSAMIHFSYAIFQNYEIKKEDVSEEQDFILIFGNYEFEKIYEDTYTSGQYKLADYDGETITVGTLKEFGDALDARVVDKIIGVSTSANYHNYNIPLDFSYYNYGIGPSEIACSNIKSGLLGVTGRYFTEEEFVNGDKLALVFDYEHINIGQNPITGELLYDENHIKLGDELFEIIGYQNTAPEAPLISVLALPDDTQIKNFIRIDFDDSVTLYDYRNVCNAAEQVFGSLAEVQPVILPDIDTLRLYNTIIVIAVIISAIAAINYAILYRYILRKRYRQISYMRLCGMSYLSTIGLYLGECLALSVPAYVLTAAGFAKWLMPRIADKYAYGFEYLNKNVYLALFGIYFGISLAVLLFMLFTTIKKNRILCEG